MCGRFSFAYEDWSGFLEMFNIDVITSHYPPRYNIAPSQMIPAIISDGKQRRFGKLKWGLQPAAWDGGGPKPINTRLDTAQRNQIFRDLVQRKRCIVPIDGYFEWHRNTKKPFRTRVKSQEIFGLAAIYDTWKSPDGPLHTCSILTTEANITMMGLHDRMPIILRKEDYRFWVDHSKHSLDELLPVLQQYPGTDMYSYEVSSIVGNVRNDTQECIQPLTS